MPSLGFRGRLLVANLAVVVLGSGVVFFGVGLVAPGLFDNEMGRAMGSDPMGMSGMMDAAVRGSFQDAVGTSLLIAIAVSLLGAVLFSIGLSAQVARPLGRLAEASRRIAGGRYEERVTAPEDDEIGRLASSFNRMAASLQATEQRRTELVGDVAHELRTPLATLDGYLEGLEDGVIPASPATWQVLRGETGRLKRLVDDLQELWRTEAGQLRLDLRPIRPDAALAAAAERGVAAAGERNVRIRVDVSPGLPAVRADPDRLAQILDNYVSNAIRYAPADEVVLRGRVESGGVALSVVDHGPGLAPEERERVFERFYRVDHSRSRANGGAGIGLAVARALVEAMDGRAWAESAGPGLGSTFSVWLPAAPSGGEGARSH